ncbi:hypothetical protein [uncultured Lacinutrix sp.]|uniref:hypothetical protein n=1 Tax=uncultured Lacinutrix sp. TaxID=574032 RepID=UPI00260C7385|nr:hypothetical protein [uncultured Lacinutrix sp.]
MYRFFIFCLFILSSCKSENKDVINKLTIPEKIANAHGFENWEKVSEIQFTFNVDRDSSHYERSWVWKPKTNAVTMLTKKDTISYNRNKMDSISLKTDRAFVNDKYWALFPFQFVWDKDVHFSEPVKSQAPISKEQLNKITLLYGDEGGYTPGDAYDVFYDDNYSIKEWVFREGNTKKPSITNTFENYENFNGIKIARDHKKAEGNWNLSITNVKVKVD